MSKKLVHMIGNAHLDPIWLWRWQEGSAEAKATIRSALDRMNENEDFIFVCSSASIYEWIEEFAPEMFEEIKLRVKEGRFVIVGGWYVQPDCNLPSGEGFARQGLYSQRYFWEKFGVTAKVGYNVDSFGHNNMLPQILKKSGMNGYIFGRPMDFEKKLPENLFLWQSPDGSQIPAYRITEPYCYNMTTPEELVERLERVVNEQNENAKEVLFFYGVGNHGGGPTKKNIELIHNYQQNEDKYELKFSNLNDFFENVCYNNLPVLKEDLQHHASGCYAAVSKIKNDVRRAENELVASEVYALIGVKLANRKYPFDDFRRAWKNVCFAHFHDVISGTSIASAFTDFDYFMGEALMIASREQNNALQTISWKIDTSDREKGIPVIFFNPFAWDFEGFLQINAHTPYMTDDDGKQVQTQIVHSEAYNTIPRGNTMLKVKIPAMGYSTYYYPQSGARAHFWPDLTHQDKVSNENPALTVNENTLENEHLKVVFDLHSGTITSLYDKDNECELLSAEAAVPIVIDEYGYDTWAHAKEKFDKVIGRFTNAKFRIKEKGALMVSLVVESYYNNSILTQEFALYTGEKQLKVNAKVDWREKHKMLKLSYPISVTNPKAIYEIPFGIIERNCDGTEEFGHSWIAIKGDERTVAIINNNKYSSSFDGNTVNFTVLRSPIYADHGAIPKSEDSKYTDQGIHEFKYSVMPVVGGWNTVIRKARELNETPANIVENNHEGFLPTAYCGIDCDKDNVIVSAFKKSEDGKGTVLRAYETDGKQTNATFSGDLLGEELSIEFSPYSIKTIYIDDKTKAWKEVLLTEFDL
jgi:alpha-mannosidase